MNDIYTVIQTLIFGNLVILVIFHISIIVKHLFEACIFIRFMSIIIGSSRISNFQHYVNECFAVRWRNAHISIKLIVICSYTAKPGNIKKLIYFSASEYRMLCSFSLQRVCVCVC